MLLIRQITNHFDLVHVNLSENLSSIIAVLPIKHFIYIQSILCLVHWITSNEIKSRRCDRLVMSIDIRCWQMGCETLFKLFLLKKLSKFQNNLHIVCVYSNILFGSNVSDFLSYLSQKKFIFCCWGLFLFVFRSIYSSIANLINESHRHKIGSVLNLC